MLGGYKAQGRTAAKAQRLVDEARGARARRLLRDRARGDPRAGRRAHHGALTIPTIGIGAGAGCDGQVLVWHDLLGLTPGHVPRFVKQYADLGDDGAHRAGGVRRRRPTPGDFPEARHTYAMPDDEQKQRFRARAGRLPAARATLSCGCD